MIMTVFQMVAAISAEPVTVSIGRYVTWNGEIKASEILTTISVVISFSTLIAALWKDIQTRRSAEADRVRSAAAKTLSKLQRWKTLALWYYRDVQPYFVETSELLAQEFDVDKARDHLWRVLTAARIKSAERIIGESLETAYIELASYYPNIFDVFTTTLKNMSEVDESRYGDFLEGSQMSVLKYEGHEKDYFAAKLGNDLRRDCALVKSLLDDQISTVSEPVEHFLADIIKRADSEILARKHNEIALPRIPTNGFPTIFERLKIGAAAVPGEAFEDRRRGPLTVAPQDPQSTSTPQTLVS